MPLGGSVGGGEPAGTPGAIASCEQVSMAIPVPRINDWTMKPSMIE